MVTEGRFLVKTQETFFGEMLCFDLPEGADAVILCVNEGRGLIPPRLSLPHQIYTKRILEYVREKYPRAEEFVVIPVRSAEYIQVWKDR